VKDNQGAAAQTAQDAVAIMSLRRVGPAARGPARPSTKVRTRPKAVATANQIEAVFQSVVVRRASAQLAMIQ
jgi:hypothetical protein